MRALRSHGFRPTLVERAADGRPSGMGIYVPGNGGRALGLLGVSLGAPAQRVRQRRVFWASGAPAFEVEVSRAWGEHPCYGFHRHDLHELLREGLPEADIRLGVSLTSLQEQGETVQVEFGEGSTEHYDLVIGADGRNSVARMQTLGEVELRCVRRQVGRFVCPRPPDAREWTLWMGKHANGLLIPVREAEVYGYLERSDLPEARLEPADFLEPFRAFGDPLGSVIAKLDPETLHLSRVDEVPDLDCWGRGRVVLMGDAAHAMPPFAAQGGALAFEDAWVLGRVLAELGDWSDAAAAFTRARKTRVNAVRAANLGREKKAGFPWWLKRLALPWIGPKALTADYAPVARALESRVSDR